MNGNRTNAKLKPWFRCVLFGLFVFSGYSLIAQSPAKRDCSLSGTVYDLQDSVVPGSRVVFRNGKQMQKALVDQKAKFQVNLDPGTYEVLIARRMEFWNYMRSRINVTCKSDLRVNLYVLPECVSYGCERLGSHFDVFTNEKKLASEKKSEIIIAYFEKEKSGSEVVYLDGVLTFDHMTVRAKQILFNVRTNKIVARDGWIEAGDSRHYFSKHQIEISESILSSGIRRNTVLDRANIRILRKTFKEMQEAGIFQSGN